VPFRGGKCISVCSASARRLFAACFPHARSLVVPQLDPARRLAAGLAACFPLAGCPLPLPPLAVCSPLAPRLPAPCLAAAAEALAAAAAAAAAVGGPRRALGFLRGS
jgi:hypothetical protein